VLRKERYPLKLSLAHAVWFGVMAVAPAPAARELIRLRFKRNTSGEPYREALRRVLRALRGRALPVTPEVAGRARQREGLGPMK
jgi:hypothetical protein